MNGRPSADWERIEIQYRAGSMSTREIATEHGISHTAINKRASKHQWVRDLAPKVHAAAAAKVSRAVVTAEVSTGTRITEQLTIEVESKVQARVRLSQRSDINRARALGQKLLAELELQSVDSLLLEQFGEIMRNPGEYSQDRMNDFYSKVTSLPGRVDTAEKLVRTIKMTMALETAAYGLDAKNAGDPAALNPLAALLLGMKRSELPVFQDVERDESL